MSNPDIWNPDDPSLDPSKAHHFEGVLDARTLWPEDANELMELTDAVPTFEELGDTYYFDKLREWVNREHLKPIEDDDSEL